jgi:hypothetical protein
MGSWSWMWQGTPVVVEKGGQSTTSNDEGVKRSTMTRHTSVHCENPPRYPEHGSIGIQELLEPREVEREGERYSA